MGHDDDRLHGDLGLEPTTSQQSAPMVLLDVDSNPNNVRDSAENLRGLAYSIKACGVLEPLVINPADDEDGGWQIRAGHRRKYVAIVAKRSPVPCVTRADLIGFHTVRSCPGENLQREGLIELEEVRGYQQALDLGASASRIARLSGVPAHVVLVAQPHPRPISYSRASKNRYVSEVGFFDADRSRRPVLCRRECRQSGE